MKVLKISWQWNMIMYDQDLHQSKAITNLCQEIAVLPTYHWVTCRRSCVCTCLRMLAHQISRPDFCLSQSAYVFGSHRLGSLCVHVINKTWTESSSKALGDLKEPPLHWPPKIYHDLLDDWGSSSQRPLLFMKGHCKSMSSVSQSNTAGSLFGSTLNPKCNQLWFSPSSPSGGIQISYILHNPDYKQKKPAAFAQTISTCISLTWDFDCSAEPSCYLSALNMFFLFLSFLQHQFPFKLSLWTFWMKFF